MAEKDLPLGPIDMFQTSPKRDPRLDKNRFGGAFYETVRQDYPIAAFGLSLVLFPLQSSDGPIWYL